MFTIHRNKRSPSPEYALGNESGFSNKISAHTDAKDRTAWNVSATCSQEAKNTEITNIPLAMPDPNSLALPNPVVAGPTWTWKYGPDPTSDVGPSAGNWALVKWTVPAGETVNDFRLQRKRASDPDWIELDLDLIPGDDWGIRQFIWAMPLELACEDANYQIVGVDYYGRASIPSATFPASKRKLIPENPRASAANNQVTISWDPLPLCGQDPTHVLTGYTLVKSKTSVSTCVGTMPLDPNSYETVSSVFPAVTSLTYWSSPDFVHTQISWYSCQREVLHGSEGEAPSLQS